MSKSKRTTSYRAIYPDRSTFFTGILKRLIDDVGPYIDLVRTPHDGDQYFGNFALIRMLMPVVETISRAERRQPWDVLKDMDVPLPRLTWTMFRHALAHNDNPLILSWGQREVSWVISPFRHEHAIYKDRNEVHIDCTQLYNDICNYLERQIRNPKKRNALQRIGVRITRPKAEERSEFRFFDS